MSYATAFNTNDYSDDAIEMVGYQNRFYALLEKHPMFILPLFCWEDLPDEKAKQMHGFLFSLFNQNGIIITSASGVFIDPAKCLDSISGPYKHSKMKVGDFLILTDVHGESDFALNRLVELAATDCKLPFIARVHGKGFEAAVALSVPIETGGWKTIHSASLINMLLQSRCSASPCPLLDLPFAIECVYETHDTEKKLYKLSADTELLAFDRGNHKYTHWEDYPVK